jgi:hypothetical protein
MIRYLLLLVNIIFCTSLTFGQHANKFSHSLAEYQVVLKTGNEWRRVTYEEVQIRYRKFNANFDDFLNNKKEIALFMFVPKDSVEVNEQTSIMIEIDSLTTSKRNWPAKDTMQSFGSFLQRLPGGRRDKRDLGGRYFDKNTNSVISKNSLVMTSTGEIIDGDTSKVYYLIIQQKDIGEWHVTIEYRCLVREADKYFPLFEQVISSFK